MRRSEDDEFRMGGLVARAGIFSSAWNDATSSSGIGQGQSPGKYALATVIYPLYLIKETAVQAKDYIMGCFARRFRGKDD